MIPRAYVRARGGVARRQWLWVLAVLLVSGCTANRDNNDDLDALLAMYRAENEKLTANRNEVRQQGIRRLHIERQPGQQALVSVDLVEARLDVVVQTILDEADVSYVSESPRLLGRVSARFEERPLVEALEILLGSRRMTASLEGSLVRLQAGGADPRLLESVGDEPGDDDEKLTVEFPLSYTRAERAMQVLEQLYPINEDDGTRHVLFASRPETNSIFLSGPRGHVDDAMRLLSNLDSDPGHVLLEALIVEFNVQKFLHFGSRIANGAAGSFSNFFFDVANLVGDTISFSRVANAANTTSFTAVLNILIQREEARIITRPYVTTVSGVRAHLEIAEDRFIVVETPGSIDVTLEAISSGVSVDLLPVVTADGTILLEISIDESRFIPTLENVEQRRARNNVSTFAHLQSGQTVIIGGLMLNTRAESGAGIPGLRNVFPLNYFFGHRDSSRQTSQVMIFITPHVWEPAMDSPLRANEPFQVYSKPTEESSPEEGKSDSDEER